MKPINNIIVKRLVGIKLWHLLMLFILISEVFTSIIVSLMSIVFYGYIKYDYLLTGFIAGFLVSLIVVYILMLLINHLKVIHEKNLQSKEE